MKMNSEERYIAMSNKNWSIIRWQNTLRLVSRNRFISASIIDGVYCFWPSEFIMEVSR